MWLKKREIQQLFKESLLGFGNSIKNPYVMERISKYGITETVLQGFIAVREKAVNLYMKTDSLKGKRASVYMKLSAKVEVVYDNYMGYIKVLRLAYTREPEVMEELRLYGERDTTFMGKITTMKEFYAICRDSGNLAEKVNQFGLTQEFVQGELDKVAAVMEDVKKQGTAIMEAEKATEERDKAIMELNRVWSIQRQVLINCFEKDDTQQLEEFSIKVPQGGFKAKRKRKKKGENEDQNQTEEIAVDGDNSEEVVDEIKPAETGNNTWNTIIIKESSEPESQGENSPAG